MNYLKMLTKLGISSAHPGGFAATLRKLDYIQIPKQMKVLEVGCGTGRTACHLAKEGYEITAVDLSAEMIQKAKLRADVEQVSVNFQVGDIHNLPMESAKFDLLLAESVTNFGRVDCVLQEYRRVLRPGGMLCDREVVLTKDIPQQDAEVLHDFFGVPKLLTVEDWKQAVEDAEFHSIVFWDYRQLNEELLHDHYQHDDPLQMMSEGAFADFDLWATIRAYNELMERYQDVLASVVIIGRVR